MSFLKNILFKFVKYNPKRNYGVKRKYPVDPEHAETLPVFDYSLSRKDRLRVYAWGHPNTGALGIALKEEKGDIITKTQFPKRLTFAEYNEVISVATGFGFTAFIVKDGDKHKLFATGLNTDSQIGYHVLKNKNKHLDQILIPQPVDFATKNTENLHISKISAGRAHMLVLTEEGLFTFGNNAYGQCGRQVLENEQYNGSRHVHHIAEIEGNKIINIEAGQDHSLAITEGGEVFGTGWGADGQTGLEHYNTVSSFTRVKGDIEKEQIIKIASTSDFVLALNDKGEIFGWGNTEYGQLPSHSNQQCNTPTYLKLENHIGTIKDIATGGTFCIILDDKGDVHVWGYGLLGLGPNATQSLKPTQLPPTLFGRNEFNPDSRVTSVAAGLFHMAAVTNNGELYMWGRNKCGCLGFGNDKQQYFPLKVALGASVKEIHCSADHTVALCKPYA